jgi:hypothetical protein
MSAPHNSSPDPTAATPRGFIYFCEERRQYIRGVRAWIFWAPYLTAAILLEPRLPISPGDPHAWTSWLPLLGFLMFFSIGWRFLLRRLSNRPKKSDNQLTNFS